MFRDFPTFSRICIFFLLTLSLLLFFLQSFSPLCFSSAHIVGSLTSKLPSIMTQHMTHPGNCSWVDLLWVKAHRQAMKEVLRFWLNLGVPWWCTTMNLIHLQQCFNFCTINLSESIYYISLYIHTYIHIYIYTYTIYIYFCTILIYVVFMISYVH